MNASPLRKVLIVEDDPIHRRVLAALVRQSGRQESFCENGFEALELLQEEEFSALIVDLRLPRMSGLELLQKLRESFSSLLGRVVVVSGAEEELVSQVDVSEIAGLVRKPIDLADFQLVLARCLDGDDEAG